MEIFDKDGHLTVQALKALVRNDPLEELTRLEMAEHLSFCDRCLQRYTELLTDDVLLTPSPARRRMRHISPSRQAGEGVSSTSSVKSSV